ncbi:WG repeat-containing protein [Pseudomonas sp. CAN2814]|uniref:WG repeat-containing protein n=1 Tax=Pseudomonas sp. CAN1 TaxID=3046726 RepID=UPI002648A9B2|nr:WG repeat-containing protein [Pseudomonas sp. CAN1]MDN6860881.1 WG repeat-containing protein [Pseudomonas sp. CAN1]
MNKCKIHPLHLAALAASLLALAACKPAATDSQTTAVPVNQPATALCLNGQCGVLAPDGKVLLGFDNDFGNILATDLASPVFASRNGHWDLVSLDGSKVLKHAFTNELILLPNQLFGFARDGLYGVMDRQGEEVIAPRFDRLTPGSDGRYIVYEIDGWQGVMDTHGKLRTEAVYDWIQTQGDGAGKPQLLMARRGTVNWVIDLGSGAQQPVAYDHIGPQNQGYSVVSAGGLFGLADSSGTALFGLKYPWLGIPSQGLVAFREAQDKPCGYLDYQGRIAIEARFVNCLPFGKQGAMTQEWRQDGSSLFGQYGLIDRQGQWKLEPTYDFADQAGISLLGQGHHVPGYAMIGHYPAPMQMTRGIFSTDDGKEILAPIYEQIGALGQGLFLFSDRHSPRIRLTYQGEPAELPAVGVVDRSAIRLVAPRDAIGFSLDPSGRFLRSQASLAADAPAALYDLQGRLVVPARGQVLEVDTRHGLLRDYSLKTIQGQDWKGLLSLRDLQGKVQFSVRRTECGAAQLVDSADKPIWPLDPTPYCPALATN